jgi:DNA-binding MarR family transcriptional regulator
MAADDFSLLADLVRACALLEKFVREAVASSSLNDTDVWVLVAIAGLLETSPAIPEARSSASVSSRLGFERGRVGMSVKGLIKQGFVRPGSKVKGQDGRTRGYLPTSAGLREADRLREELVLLEREVRFEGGIARNARAVDPQIVAHCLETFSVWRDIPLSGLNRRRVSAVRKAGESIEENQGGPTAVEPR